MEFLLFPQRFNSDGLYHSLLDGIQSLGISVSDAPTCKKLVSIATDGAAANIASAGLKRRQYPMDFLDVVSSTSFGVIN